MTVEEAPVFEPGTRIGWDWWFVEIARAVSLRADCSRRQVGAVIAKEHRIASTGYNGGPSGGPSCLRGECPRGLASREDVPGYLEPEPSSYDIGPGSCIAIHAEQNAVMYASREQREGATLYITCAPCPGCARMAAGSGITSIVYPEGEELIFLDLDAGEWVHR